MGCMVYVGVVVLVISVNESRVYPIDQLPTINGFNISPLSIYGLKTEMVNIFQA